MTPEDEPTKTCSDCRGIIPTSLFNPNPKKADGLNRYCCRCEDVRKLLYEAFEATGDPTTLLE